MRGHRTKRTRRGRYTYFILFYIRTPRSGAREPLASPLRPPLPAPAFHGEGLHVVPRVRAAQAREVVRAPLSAQRRGLPEGLSPLEHFRHGWQLLLVRHARLRGDFRGLPTRGVRRRGRARCGRARCERCILDRRPGRMSSSRRVVDRGGCFPGFRIAISDEVRLRFVRRHAKSTRELERVNADAVRRPAPARGRPGRDRIDDVHGEIARASERSRSRTSRRAGRARLVAILLEAGCGSAARATRGPNRAGTTAPRGPPHPARSREVARSALVERRSTRVERRSAAANAARAAQLSNLAKLVGVVTERQLDTTAVSTLTHGVRETIPTTSRRQQRANDEQSLQFTSR